MATLPTPEENAKTILKMFAEHNCRPGHVLMISQLQGAIAHGAITAEDFKSGLMMGGELGWFENGPNNSVKLTQAGFDAM